MKKLLFIIWLSTLFSCTQPKITITEPIDGYKSPAKFVIIKGFIDPPGMPLSYENEYNEIAVIDGKFEYKVHLPDSVNKIRINAISRFGEIFNEITIKRDLTKEELDKIKADKKKKEAERLAEEKKWNNSKAGKINKKHPEWSKRECERLANGETWIGMSYEMLKSQRGYPDSANPSDYGTGTHWQWCWHDLSPSCFYDNNNDGLIDSYN